MGSQWSSVFFRRKTKTDQATQTDSIFHCPHMPTCSLCLIPAHMEENQTSRLELRQSFFHKINIFYENLRISNHEYYKPSKLLPLTEHKVRRHMD